MEKKAKIEALKNINITIKKAEFVTISGKSGCGKTTLLNVLGGIIKPDSGKYLFEGEDVSGFSDKKMAAFRNKSIGFVVQHFALINDRTVYENVVLPLRYRHKKALNDSKNVDQILEELDIISKKNKYPYQISGGERQRTAIARSIIADTTVILADEPTGSLDEENGKKILGILKKLNEEGKTIILVTHDPGIAKEGTKRIVMKDGEIFT